MESHGNTFTAAVRGYHYYQGTLGFWRPKENEKRTCLHEPGNGFDRYTIKDSERKWRNCWALA